jgi:hypothetical protein
LAILKINGEELLDTRDDGAFLDILKSFFRSIGNPNDQNQNQYTRLTVKKKKKKKKNGEGEGTGCIIHEV